MTIENGHPEETYHHALRRLDGIVGELDLTPRQRWEIGNLMRELVAGARELERQDYQAQNVVLDQAGHTWLRVPPADHDASEGAP